MIVLYLDPGSGSYLIQAIIAGVLGAWFWLKGYWWKIKSFFTKHKQTDISKNQENEVNN